jgi:hypothetical protein
LFDEPVIEDLRKTVDKDSLFIDIDTISQYALYGTQNILVSDGFFSWLFRELIDRRPAAFSFIVKGLYLILTPIFPFPKACPWSN